MQIWRQLVILEVSKLWCCLWWALEFSSCQWPGPELLEKLGLYQCQFVSCSWLLLLSGKYQTFEIWIFSSWRVIFVQDHLYFDFPIALNVQIEINYEVDRLLNGLLTLWVVHTAQCSSMKIPPNYREDLFYVEVFSWWTIALYVPLTELKDL